MTVTFARGLGAAIACTLSAQAAFADVTAQQVWTDWRDYAASAGYDITATESMAGGTLTVSDLSMAMQFPEQDGSFSIDIGQLRLVENRDGTVKVEFPQKFPMRFNGIGDDGEKVAFVVDYAQDTPAMVVSGTPQDMQYAYSAAQVDVTLSSMTVNGAPVPEGTARVDVSVAGIDSTARMQRGEMRNFVQEMTADSLSYDIAFADPDSTDRGSFKGGLQGLSFTGSGQIPLDMNTADLQALLNDGFAFDGRFDYTAGNTSMSGSGEGSEFAATSSSQGGTVSVAMNQANISYDVNQKQSALSIQSSDLPFPVSMEMALAALKMNIPVAKSDAEQDFSFAMSLSDFTMSDMIWSMFDPAAALPRDPATVVLDLTGKVKVLFNFLDPQVAEVLDATDQPPGELNALTINKFLVSMVGARLTGTGDFTFDNTDLESFDGMPRPAGHLELQLTGGNGLLDKLIGMGVVGDEEAMGARMMMGMLAVPGQEPDTLNSRIEINDQGHVMANGQRIK